MVLTMLDLRNFQLKRSIHPVHYVYVFHSMGSTHMVDHENSYDHYDSLLCTGPHHVTEIRRREELKGLPPKHLFPYGYPRLERLVEVGRRAVARSRRPPPPCCSRPRGESSRPCTSAASRLSPPSSSAGIRVILRPHYQTARLAPRLVDSLVARFRAHPQFRHVDRMEESASLLRVRSPDQRLVRHGHRVRPRPRQAGALRRRPAPGAEPEVRGARPRADGDAHPPRARSRSCRSTAWPTPRSYVAELDPRRRRSSASAASALREAMDVQLRPERRGGSAGDRPHRRRAGGHRRARDPLSAARPPERG